MERNTRRLVTGLVVSTKMEKTVVVSVETKSRHPIYGKLVKTRKKYYAHNHDLPLDKGDVVQLMETRPLSKLKRWRVSKVIEKALKG